LTQEQRYTISVMIKQNHSQAQIARTIGKCKSVVCRELKRNCDKRNGEYRYDLAQRKYEERMKNKPKYIKFTGDLKEKTLDLLEEDLALNRFMGDLKVEAKKLLALKQFTVMFGKIKLRAASFTYTLDVKVESIGNVEI